MLIIFTSCVRNLTLHLSKRRISSNVKTFLLLLTNIRNVKAKSDQVPVAQQPAAAERACQLHLVNGSKKMGPPMIVSLAFHAMGCNTSKPKKKKQAKIEENKQAPEAVPLVSDKLYDDIEEATGSNVQEVADDETVSISEVDELSSSATSQASDTSVKEKTDASEIPKKEPPEPLKPIDRIRQEALEAHNMYREMHGSPPLQLNAELNIMAQKWAEHLAVTTSFEHSPKDKREGTGENLAAHTDILTGAKVTEMWYNEIEDYDFLQPGFKPGTGHFTQLIWRKTTHMGLGMSSQSAKDGMYRYVANYRPSGNWKGEFQDNVLQRISNP